MIDVTFSLAVVFALLALTRKQGGAAIGIMVMSMLVWPDYLRFPFGFAEMSIPRLVALLLLFKAFFTGRHRKINFGEVDVLVLFIWLWTIIATVLADANFAQAHQIIGRGLDTVLIYFVTRMMVLSKEDIKGIFFWVGITALYMCFIGVYESITSFSPYKHLVDFRTWHWIDKEDSYRLGFLRARASTSVHIYFGMSMMLILGLLISIRGFIANHFRHRIVCLAAFLAALSSWSSGPWLACFMIFGFIGVFEKRTRLIKPSVFLVVLMGMFLEISSNRHFYNLIDYIALDSQTAWYRTKLLEAAVSQWRDFWLVGVGSNWPHNWANLVDGRDHIDVVNHFLIVALYGGLPAMLMYIASHVIAIRQNAREWRNSDDDSYKKLLFALPATLIALDISSMSVGLFGPVLPLSHILLGLMVNASVAWSVNTTVADHGRNDPFLNKLSYSHEYPGQVR